MPRLFGTDGVRGVANADLTPDLALALGRAAGLVLSPGGGTVVVGRDTRLSGPMLEAALTAGLCSAGVDVAAAGVIPTPGVAFLTLEEKARAGGVISASHNPVGDNGIKFFAEDGFKTRGDVEDAIEAAMAEPGKLPTHTGVGTAYPLSGALERYSDHVVAALGRELGGLHVALDLAHGAACGVATEVFERAGARATSINDDPDGSLINVECGSTSLAGLSERVLAEGAALGLAFDGDADRVLAVDEKGVEVDGDRILGLMALHAHEEGRLKNNVLVVTVMSNLGFKRALEQRGIEVVSAPVGDKFVAEEMVVSGAVIGGEQSGHIILAEHSTTGDGLLAGLMLAGIVAASDRPLSELAHFFEPYPQLLINVPVRSHDELEGAQELWDEVARVESRLGEEGRALLRASGTEQIVRVMVEAADPEVARETAEGLAETVKRLLG